ncbi:hypothetical protein V2J09_001173 [Rumex salicifolius]
MLGLSSLFFPSTELVTYDKLPVSFLAQVRELLGFVEELRSATASTIELTLLRRSGSKNGVLAIGVLAFGLVSLTEVLALFVAGVVFIKASTLMSRSLDRLEDLLLVNVRGDFVVSDRD